MQNPCSYHDPAECQTSESNATRSLAVPPHVARSHLSEADIACYVDGTVDGSNRTRIQHHLATCSECARAVGDVVRLTRDLHVIARDNSESAAQSGVVSPDPEIQARVEFLVPDTRRKRSPDRLSTRGKNYWASRVGIPMALVALFWIFRSTGSDSVSRFRSADTPSPVHLIVPSDGAVLGKNDWRFELDPIQGALAYRFTVSTLAGDLTYRSERTSPVISVPDSIPRTPGRYAWTVDVVLKNGRVVSSEMGTFVFDQ